MKNPPPPITLESWARNLYKDDFGVAGPAWHNTDPETRREYRQIARKLLLEHEAQDQVGDFEG